MKRLWRACVLVPVVCLAAGGLYLAAVKAVRWYEARRLEARREAERGKWERLQQAHPVEDLRRAVRESPGEFGKMLKEQGIEAGEFLRSVSSEGGQFRLGPGPSGRAFDVKFRRVIKPTEGAKPAPGGPQTRRLRYSVALNYQDAANYYSIGFAPDGVSVAKVEGWCERGIGTASSEGLAGRTSAEVVIKKRDHSLAVVLDGRTVAKAYDDAFTGGQIGFWTSSPEVAFEEVKCQPVGEIYFSDDFMRGSEQASEWETVAGQWRLNSLDNVSMSSNAFTFEGKGGERPGLAVAGHWFWDNYAFQVACQRRGDEPAGLCFGYRDAENYYAARWGAEKAQILKVRQGKATVVAEADVPIRKAEWYELRADVADETARVFVDDNLTLSIADPELSFGRVGLYAEGPNGALFDDVRVRDLRRFEDDFSKDCPGKWTPLGGSWQWHDGVMRGQATGPAKAVAGNVRWQDYELAVDVARPAQGQIGLCVNYQDEANYYVLRLDANDATLAKVAEGVGTDLATAQGVKWHEGAGRLRVVTRGGWLAAFFERDLLLQAFDAGLRAGKVGLYVDGAVADFDNVRVDFLPELRPVFTTHEVFSGELSMAQWAAAQSDWHAESATIQGRPATLRWHRAAIFGPHEVVASVGKDFSLHIVTAGQPPKAEEGYLLTCTGSGTQVEAALLRKGAEVGRGKCALAAPASRVRLARRGNCLIAYADDEPLLGWVDPSPLSGTAVAYAGDIPPEKVQVLSDDVWVYTFEDAPADWRVESGRWEVTNRWQCDPRWSFFSGRPDGKAKLAALWNKREFSGDVCLEFAAAIQMDRARGGRYYEYARDINATLCADGYDLTSGYSFIFGGWQNRHTRILRGKEVVAETTGRLIPRDIHNTWFYIKVEKRGPHLSFWIDNEPVLKYTDARPLAGRRLALWTYDVGVMLARVRVSSPEHKDREWPVAANPSAQKSCYDETVVAKPVPTPPASPVAAQTAALIQKLADPSDEVRWNAAMELAALGEAAVPALVEALSTASDEPRWKAEAALRKIGSPAVPHLVAALKDARVVVRRSAAYLLGEMAGDAAITALGETLCDADDDVRWKAAVALTHLGQACVPVALKQLASDNAEARKCAAWMLQEVQSVEAVGPLVAALSDPDRDVAWKAAIALKKLGPSVVPQLAPALSSERPRRYVVWLLKELPGAEAATALAKLVSTTPPAKAQPTSVPAPAQPLLPATLQVTSTPEKATVFLYDRYIGLTPVTVPQVAVGPHALKLVKRGYEAWAEPVLVLPDATEVRATLKAKASAQLSVTSTPDRADVYVDDKLAGATPLLLTGLPADTYRVRIQKDNYAPWKSEVAAAADQVTRVHGQLTLKAEAYYLAAIKKEPNVAAHYSELAHLYALENKFDKMRDALAKAVELIATGQSDGDGRVRQEIAKIYMASFVYGDERALASARAEIEKLLENEIRQRPKVLETHLLLGRLYENAGRAAEAIQAATRAVQLFPERYEPEWMLGRAYMVKYQAGDAAAARLARSHLEAAIRLCQTPRERAEIEKHLRQLPA